VWLAVRLLLWKSHRQTRSFSTSFECYGVVDFATDVQTIEKLLAAVNRLRGERDELRRQLQVEPEFTIEALKCKINSGAALTKAAATATAEDPRVFQLQSEVQGLLERGASGSGELVLTNASAVVGDGLVPPLIPLLLRPW
jgi:hypothetical protein